MINLYLSNFFVISALTYLGYLILEFRVTNQKQTIFLFIITFFLMCIINYNGVSNFSAFLMLTLFLLYVFIQFKGNTFNKFLLIISFFIITAISEITVGLILNQNIGFDGDTNINSLSYTFALILSNILILVLIFLFKKIKDIFLQTSLPIYAWLIFILPLTTVILIININNYYDLLEHKSSLLIILFGLFLSNFVFIIVFVNSVRNLNLKNELNLEKYKQHYSQTKYDLLDQQYKINFNLLHTLMNKCYKLEESLNNEDYKNANKQIKELTELTFKEFNTIYSNSVVINTLINNRIETIKKNNLIINSTIEYNNYNFIEFCDQIDLFSILLDYSIKETINSIKYKNIIIKSEKNKNQLIICFQFANNNDKTNEKNLITSVTNLIKKYDATISIYPLNDKISSIVIVFPSK